MKKYEQYCIAFSSVSDSMYSLIGTSAREHSYPGYKKEIKLNKAMFGDDGKFNSSIAGCPFILDKAISEKRHEFDDTI